MNQRSQAGIVVVHQLEAPSLGQIAKGQQNGTFFEPSDRCADQLHQSPSGCRAASDLDGSPDVLPLNARERPERQFQIVRMDKVDHRCADRVRQRSSEEGLSGAIGPPQATLGVHDDYRVGELTEESGQHVFIERFRRRKRILEAGNLHELHIGVMRK